MKFNRMVIEKESPEEMGYGNIKYNLTESSVRDLTVKDLGVKLDDLVLAYTDHSGKPELRQLIARNYGSIPPENILLTTGACLAIFIANITLLSPGDRMVVVRPNYAANLEVPRSLGITQDILDLQFDEQYRINLAALDALITPKTKVVSITYPHNPTGTVIDEATLRKIVDITRKKKVHLIVDETYRDLSFATPPPVAASLGAHVISIESFSKAYGIPGIRIGWLATQDKALKDQFVATKEQIIICGSVVDEEIAHAMYQQRSKFMDTMRGSLQKKFETVKAWIHSQPDLEWVQPRGGVVCFPRIKRDVNIDVAKFYRVLNEKYGVFVGPGHWFEQDDRFFRLGYGWPTEAELAPALQAISKALQEAKT
jgi:aspartate/methionine/tyrosine aminotransferase